MCSSRAVLVPIALAVATASSLSACGDGDAPAAGGSRSTGTSTSAPPVPPSGPSVPRPTPGEHFTVDTVPADEPVLRLGLVDRGFHEDEPLAVTVYADRTVILADEEAPFGFSSFRLKEAAFDELLAEAAGARPFEKADYGEATVSDVGTTVVTFHVDQGSTTVSVWALGHTESLTTEQAEAHERLDGVASMLLSLGNDSSVQADAPRPYEPTRVNVTLSEARDYGSEERPESRRWPLDTPPHLLRGYATHLGAFGFQVTGGDISAVRPAGDEVDVVTWTVPDDVRQATPATVFVSLRAALPGDDEPCEGAPTVEPPQPVDDIAPNEWETPWPADRRTTVSPFEHWMSSEALVERVLPRHLDDAEGWDWTRWSWFDERFIGVELGGRRYIDVLATCTPYVTDEEPNCTIRARFDAATERLVEFDAE